MVVGLISFTFVLIFIFAITNIRANRLKSMRKTEKTVGRWERIESKVYFLIFIVAILFIIFRVVFY